MNKYFIFPFLSPIFIFIRDVLLDHAEMKTNGLRKIIQYDLYDGLMHSSCIFFYIIEFIRTGKDEKILEFEKKQYEPNKLKIFFIIITIG